MFFFFVGGVQQQVRQVLKAGSGQCIMCGSKADLVDYEKVLKVFFVPVWRWPGKEPLLYCHNCSLFFPPPPPQPNQHTLSPPPSLPDVIRCHSCARVVDSEFNFCPFCGSSL